MTLSSADLAWRYNPAGMRPCSMPSPKLLVISDLGIHRPESGNVAMQIGWIEIYAFESSITSNFGEGVEHGPFPQD